MDVKEPRIVFIVTDLLPQVAKITGKSLSQLNNSINVSLGKNFSIVGEIDWLKRGKTCKITIPFGLLLFHIRMASLFLSRMNVVDDSGAVVEKTQINQRETVEVAKKTMENFWVSSGKKRSLILSQGIKYEKLENYQQKLVAQVIHYADTFVVAHEFGHAITWAYPNRVVKEKLIVDAAINSLIEPCSIPKDHIENWKNELLADCLAIRLCLDICKNQIQKMLIHASSILSLISYHMLEKGYEQVKGSAWESRLYPPSSLRLDFMESFSDWPEKYNLGIIFRQIGDMILNS